jgi:hypothetical protein
MFTLSVFDCELVSKMFTAAGAFGTPHAMNWVEGPLCELWPAAFVVLA